MTDGSDDGFDPVSLWPSQAYNAQLAALRAAIGQTVYLVELNASPTQVSVRQTGTGYVLLAVIDFPRPDPSRGLAPHMLILDDGRGINLGHILRVSVEQAYAPALTQVLYRDAPLQQALLEQPRRLNRGFIRDHSRRVLGQFLGRTPGAGQLPANRDNSAVISPSEIPGEIPKGLQKS